MTYRLDLLRNFCRLAPLERRLLAQAWLAFHLIDVALRLLPFDTVRAWCHVVRPPRPGHAGMPSSLSVTRCAWLVGVAGRYSLVNATCLKEALVMARLLGGWGTATALRIGVARSDGGLTAHAWLEQDGRIVFNPATTAAYAPLHPCRHGAS